MAVIFDFLVYLNNYVFIIFYYAHQDFFSVIVLSNFFIKNSHINFNLFIINQWFVKKSANRRVENILIKKGKSLGLWCELQPTLAHERRNAHKHNTAGNA